MKLDTQKIKEGEYNGITVWICDLRYKDYGNKPIRRVPPTEVLIRDKSETDKTIYYSKSFFAELGKDGQPLKSKIHPLFDNTGYRSYTGVPLNVFDDRKECIHYYNEQLEEAINGLISYKKNVCKEIDNKVDELQSEKG